MIKNYTPHSLNIYSGDILIKTFEKIGNVRLLEDVQEVEETDGIPTVIKKYREATGLPEPENGTIFLVSKIVLDALPHRTDLRCPDTGPDSVIRDEAGNILGVTRLQRI